MIAPGTYDDVFCLIEGERYALGRKVDGSMRYALCDSEGNLLTGIEYEMFDAVDEVILFRKDARYGAMDLEGKIVISPLYSQLVYAGDDQYLALTTDPKDDNSDEIWVVVPEEDPLSTGIRTADGLHAFSDGRMRYRSPNSEFYGYVDAQGKSAVEPIFEFAGDFRGGLALASSEGLYGVIGVDGTWRIRPEFEYLERGDGIFLGMKEDGTCIAFNAESGVERYRIDKPCRGAAVVGSYAVILEGENLFVYNMDGEIILETSSNATLTEGSSGELILSDGEWGTQCVSVVRPSGEIAERKDQHLLPMGENRYAFITMNVASYYSDALGGIRYSCDYGSLRFGLMDASGNEILPAQYLEIRQLADQRYLLIAQDGLTVTDADGNALWQVILEETSDDPAHEATQPTS